MLSVSRAVLAALLPAVAALSAAAAEPIETVAALPAEGVQFLPVYVAEDAGIFAARGLAVRIVDLAGVGTTNGVISGSVDFGFSNGASITRAAAHGQKLVGIALLADKPTWAVMLRTDEADAAGFDPAAPLAERAHLMAGRRFAVDTIQSVAHAYARVIAKIGGLDPESVAVAPLVSTEAMAAMQRKAIDGFVATPPWQQLMERDGSAVPIADSLKGEPPWLTPFAGGLVIARRDFCAAHRETCGRMGHAIADAVSFIRGHRQDSLAILEKRFPALAPAVLERAFDVVAAAAPADPAPSAAAVANSDRLNLEAGFIAKDEQLKSYDALVTDEFVR